MVVLVFGSWDHTTYRLPKGLSFVLNCALYVSVCPSPLTEISDALEKLGPVNLKPRNAYQCYIALGQQRSSRSIDAASGGVGRQANLANAATKAAWSELSQPEKDRYYRIAAADMLRFKKM